MTLYELYTRSKSPSAFETQVLHVYFFPLTPKQHTYTYTWINNVLLLLLLYNGEFNTASSVNKYFRTEQIGFFFLF